MRDIDAPGRLVLMVEFRALPGRFRIVTSSRGHLLWADKTVRAPLIRSAVVCAPLPALRAAAIRAIKDRADRDKWPLRRPFSPGNAADLAKLISAHIRAEAWVHTDDRPRLNLNMPTYACDWMPREMVLIAPSERRVGVEWTLGQDACSLGLWGPEQVGIVG